MKLVALADIHGATSSLKSIAGDLEAADAVILAGDITNFRGKNGLLTVLDEVRKYAGLVYGVCGNCDLPEASAALAEVECGIDRKAADIRGIAIAGVGGSLPCPETTPNEFSEAEYKRFLEQEPFASLAPGSFIFVTHEPPFNTVVDKARIGKHVGSREIGGFIERARPIVCITGHIHEARGVDKIGDTRIVNPGPFKNGNYGVIEVDGLQVKEIELKSV